MVFFNRKLTFFIEHLNWHYKQKHISFLFPKNDLVVMFLRFLLNEGLIYSFSFQSTTHLLIHLKYLENSPIIREIRYFPKNSWINFNTAKSMMELKSDRFLQSYLIIVFTLHGFRVLGDLADHEGGWLLCSIVI